MIELYLSNDGKHVVRVSARTPAELADLTPKAKALHEKISENYGHKAGKWELAIDQEPIRLKSRRITQSAERSTGMAPICPIHKHPMKLQHGRYGDFWSCKVYSEQGGWCRHTVNTFGKAGESGSVA